MPNEEQAPRESIQRPETEVIKEYLDDGADHIHISGEPGIGKTTIIDQIAMGIQGYDTDIRNIRPNHGLNDFFREICHSLFNNLPEELKEEGRKFTGISIGPVGGLSWDSDEPEATRANFGYRDALLKLAELFPETESLLICLDNIHELTDDERAIKGAIEEAAETLPQHVSLITTGRLTIPDLDNAVSLGIFTEEQTRRLLRKAFPDISDDKVQSIREQVEGHPLYLGLLIESNDDPAAIELPDEDVYTEIEKRYLRFLSSDEHRLLRATAPLRELNEAVCTQVLPEEYELDRVSVAHILDSLSTRTIVQTTGRNHAGLTTYKVHDVFRDFLNNRWDRKDETEQLAFQYYAELTIKLTDETRTLETEVNQISSCLEFLTDTVIQTQADILSSLINHAIAQDGLSFYPASLLVSRLKTHRTDQLPDQVVDSVLTSAGARSNIANDFYDERLHISWAEQQFDKGGFDDPSNVLLSYLGRITDSHPDFVREVIEEATIDNAWARRYLISISTDLPAQDAASVGEKAAQWIHEADAYHELAGQGLELITYLCKQGEFDTALDLLDVILTPRQMPDEDQMEGNQGMTRYRLINTLDETFEDFLKERDTEFIEILKRNFEASLRIEVEGVVDHEVIVQHSVISDLDYVEENRGKLKHVLLDYFVRAVTEWISEDPTGKPQRDLVNELLSGHPMFRRIGFALLAAHPEHYKATVEAELTDTERYENQLAPYEFYTLLSTGYEYLDEETRHQICEIIKDGPYTDFSGRAEQLAEREDQPASYLEQRIKEKWWRDRFLLIREHLPEQYREHLEGLAEKHGEPDHLPSEPFPTAVRGGMVHQRGPAPTEDLQNQSPVEVLTTAVEWVPPQSEKWEPDDDGRLEEWSLVGFSRQIRDLIKEQPERYAREISILEDANPQYTSEALRAFKDLVDDGQTFPWSSIIELGKAITADPTSWNVTCRTNLAMLINKGIASDETTFPQDHADSVHDILQVLLTDPDPEPERDQPGEGMAGHGDPVQVAINAVRPMALNAFITYTWWTTQPDDTQPAPELLDAIEERILQDPAVAVRTVIGRRFGSLWRFDQERVERRLEDIFPRGNATEEVHRFIAAWNSYTRHNFMWGHDILRPYYIHALDLLASEEGNPYNIDVRSTSAHTLSSYLFGEEALTDEDSLISRFYRVATAEDAKQLATTLSNSIEKSEVSDQWDQIRDLWSWRLSKITESQGTDHQDHANELRQFLDCVRESDATDLAQEQEYIRQSIPHVVPASYHWRRIEEWLADQSDTFPAIAIDLFEVMIKAVDSDEWASTARMSKESNRERLYENAAATGGEALRTSLRVANRFAAERHEMDRTFLDQHL